MRRTEMMSKMYTNSFAAAHRQDYESTVKSIFAQINTLATMMAEEIGQMESVPVQPVRSQQQVIHQAAPILTNPEVMTVNGKRFRQALITDSEQSEVERKPAPKPLRKKQPEAQPRVKNEVRQTQQQQQPVQQPQQQQQLEPPRTAPTLKAAPPPHPHGRRGMPMPRSEFAQPSGPPDGGGFFSGLFSGRS
jgi:hypothetical protein